MVEVVAEDDIVAVQRLLEREGEGDAVAVVNVGGVGEVGGCGGGTFRKSYGGVVRTLFLGSERGKKVKIPR